MRKDWVSHDGENRRLEISVEWRRGPTKFLTDLLAERSSVPRVLNLTHTMSQLQHEDEANVEHGGWGVVTARSKAFCAISIPLACHSSRHLQGSFQFGA